MLRTVHVTMFPTPLLVDDEEYLDLQRQGLLVPGRADVPGGYAVIQAVAAAPPTVPSPATAKEEADGAAAQEVAQADG